MSRTVLGKRKRITTIEDFIDFSSSYKGVSVDKELLLHAIPPLKELNRMIGMKALKETVVSFALYYLGNFHNTTKYNYQDDEYDTIYGEDYLNSVILGPPGCGKTMVAKILAKVFCSLGVLSRGHLTCVKRTDFVGKYIGHSELKTEKLLKDAKGGVLFFDEAYSMGSEGRVCPFSKAAIDTLNPFLSENKEDFICIIAGYEDEIDENFFSLNKGLVRRFPWRFVIEKYTPAEMREIFENMVHKIGWYIDYDAITDDFFRENDKQFEYLGGDLETFLAKCKICHTQRVFGLSRRLKKILTEDDIEAGFEMYKSHRKKKENTDGKYMTMYS